MTLRTTTHKSVNLRLIHETILRRTTGVAEHGKSQWVTMLRAELKRLDKELTPAQDRVYALNAARRALLHEIAEVENTTGQCQVMNCDFPKRRVQGAKFCERHSPSAQRRNETQERA